MWIPPMYAVVRGLTEVWLTPARRDVDPSHVCGSAVVDGGRAHSCQARCGSLLCVVVWGLTEVGLTPARRDVDPSYVW